MRAVLDTNVLISGLFWRGAANACLVAAEAGLYELVLAEPILVELREKLTDKFDSATSEADTILANLRRVSELIALAGRGGWVADDPDDDKFVEAALVAGGWGSSTRPGSFRSTIEHCTKFAKLSKAISLAVYGSTRVN